MEVVQIQARNAKHYRQAIRNYKEERNGFSIQVSEKHGLADVLILDLKPPKW